MLDTKRLSRMLAVVAGASMLALAGPAAIANDGYFGLGGDSGGHGNGNGNGNGNGHGNGNGNGHGNGNGNGHGNGNRSDATVDPSPSSAAGTCVVVIRPEETLPDGTIVPAKTRISHQCDQASLDRIQTRVDRVAQRAEVRAAGGTWGAVQRQDALLRVATRLAERHAQVPTSAALGRILTLINEGLPVALQIDIETFLAQYDLIYADLVKARDEAPEPSPSPSPSPSSIIEPLPEPSPSASA